MSPILYLLTGAVIGAVSVWVYMSQKIKESEREMQQPEQKEQEQEQEEDASGLESFNAKRQKKIEGRKDKIVEAIKKKGSIQTGEVSDMLDVSRNTAYRYLEELEKENRVEQIQESGRAVRYRLLK
jgi:predicted HTH transcriptional regulator